MTPDVWGILAGLMALTSIDGFGGQVYATREGLVGGQTANGHIITERDWFAALPSRRGLEQTVKVCHGSRCVWLPVWDVGPWNVQDDYWNVDRQMWTDLPRGKPQAQAAFQDNHNGGRDGFGRTVRNPAGLDLADGAFWDGLQLRDNAWVELTFVPPAPVSAGEVTATVLNVRSSAALSASVVGGAGRKARVVIECRSGGWYRIGPGQFVSQDYVRVPADFSAAICAA